MAYLRCTGAPGGSLKLRTAQGEIASFETNIVALLQEIKCEINATGGNGTPDNPNPINGYSSANITRCGVNLWDEQAEVGAINGSTGENQPSSSSMRSVGYIKVYPNMKVYIKMPNYGMWVYRYGADKSYINRLNYNANTEITIPDDCYFIRFELYSQYGTTYNNDISINYPSSDTSYHPYNGTTHVISFGQTVYGGVLDVTRGKLRVTHGYVDLSTLTWSTTSLTPEIQAYATGDLSTLAKKPINNSTPLNAICSTRAIVSVNAIYSNNNAIAMNNGGSTFSRVDGASTPPTGTLAYELATPFDIDLTPQQIETLIGVNNVWHDGDGDTEVKYLYNA